MTPAGSHVFSIVDGGTPFTADVNWLSIRTTGTGGVIKRREHVYLIARANVARSCAAMVPLNPVGRWAGSTAVSMIFETAAARSATAAALYLVGGNCALGSDGEKKRLEEGSASAGLSVQYRVQLPYADFSRDHRT